MDVCNDKDCSGRGICENDESDSGYTCFCEPGFLGDDCEEGKISQNFFNFNINENNDVLNIMLKY